jgi:hypothetical protein
MYQIIGIQRNNERRLVVTTDSAREAVEDYRAASDLFSSILVNGPEGGELDLAELGRRADAESAA